MNKRYFVKERNRQNENWNEADSYCESERNSQDTVWYSQKPRIRIDSRKSMRDAYIENKELNYGWKVNVEWYS